MENLILNSPFGSILKSVVQIDVTEEKILFHIPNKRISFAIKMTFFNLTWKSIWSHRLSKLLNGNVRIESFEKVKIFTLNAQMVTCCFLKSKSYEMIWQKA